MGEVLHLGALVPAAVGACCTLGARRSGRAVAMTSSIVMLLAMLDTASGARVIPAAVWAAVLLVMAIGTAAVARFSGRRPEASEQTAGHPAAMPVLSALSLVVMAGLLLAMGLPPTGSIGPVGMATHHAGGSTSVTAVAVVTSVAFVLGSLGAVGRLVHSGYGASTRGIRRGLGAAGRLAALELLCMAGSALLMVAALAV